MKSTHSKQINIIKIGTLILYGLTSLGIYAQSPSPMLLLNNCEENNSRFWYEKEYYFDTRKIFIIGSLGKNEKSKKLNLSRVETVAKKLISGGIGKDKIIMAEGRKTSNKGRVEVYGSGYLILIFEIGLNEKLYLGNCMQFPLNSSSK